MDYSWNACTLANECSVVGDYNLAMPGSVALGMNGVGGKLLVAEARSAAAAAVSAAAAAVVAAAAAAAVAVAVVKITAFAQRTEFALVVATAL